MNYNILKKNTSQPSVKPAFVDSVRSAVDKVSPGVTSFIFNAMKGAASLMPGSIIGMPIDEHHGSLLYVGLSKRKAGFWINHFCGLGAQRKDLGRKWFKSFFGSAIEDNVVPDYLVFEEFPFNISYLNKINGFRMPEWVNMVMPLSDDFTRNKWYKLGIRITKEKEFTLRSGCSEELLALFYTHLYMPYALTRHTNDAFLYSKRAFAEELKNSEVFIIESPDGVISGLFVVYKSNGTAYLHSLGIHKYALGKNSWHISDTTYALVLRELLKKGIVEVSFGGVHPFFNGGLTFYKMKWGARPSPDIHPSNSWFRFIISHPSANVSNFLTKNPFWYSDPKQGLSIALISESGVPDPYITKELTKRGVGNSKSFQFTDCIFNAPCKK
jgi:hypothetical protein